MSNAVTVLIINLYFYTNNLYWFGDTVNIFIFPELSLLEVLEVGLMAWSWDRALRRSIMITYYDTTSLLQIQKILPTLV